MLFIVLILSAAAQLGMARLTVLVENTVDAPFLHALVVMNMLGSDIYRSEQEGSTEDDPTRVRCRLLAVADGIFEQVNNLVFRAGHCALGLSSALIGSGMAFPYDWFRGCARDFETAGEDKEMELRLLMDGIFVEYAPHIHILDEKTRSITNLQKQRRRWLHSQYALIVNAIAEFPYAKFKAGYADKLLQWLFIPRILLITGLPLLAILSIFTSSIWWLYLLATIMLFAAICLGLPAGVKIKDLAPVLNQVPAMALATLRNIFGKKTASDEFIHTDHENSN